MEVHAHSHSPRKKWTHYFWEFFMLFLAVTLGFFVENQREHYVEHQREKQYIKSMIQDLKEDTTSFRRVVATHMRACKRIDTLISLLKRDNRNQSARQIYYMARFLPFDDPSLFCQNKTFEQLKSSGGLRLIRNPDILNRISDYYQINKFIETGPTPMQFQNRRDLILVFNLLFDASVFQQMMRPADSLDSPIANDRFVLLSNDPTVINNICTRYHIMYSTKKVIANDGADFIKQASALISYLQTEYHFK